MSSRRAILKLIGAAPALAGSAASQLGPMLSSPAVAAAAAMASSTQPAGLQQQNYNGLGAVIGRKLQSLLQQTEDEMYRKQAIRVAGLDADIAAMRSTSRAWKERRQLERDFEEGSLVRHARSTLWGTP